jgi:hypothetical protein
MEANGTESFCSVNFPCFLLYDDRIALKLVTLDLKCPVSRIQHPPLKKIKNTMKNKTTESLVNVVKKASQHHLSTPTMWQSPTGCFDSSRRSCRWRTSRCAGSWCSGDGRDPAEVEERSREAASNPECNTKTNGKSFEKKSFYSKTMFLVSSQVYY